MKQELLLKDNKGMVENLGGLAMGIVTFGVIVVIGTVVMYRMGNATGGAANTTAQYFVTQMGTTGLAGWLPAIIALAIGVLFLGYFMSRGKRY